MPMVHIKHKHFTREDLDGKLIHIAWLWLHIPDFSDKHY